MVEKQLVNYSANTKKKPRRFEDHFDNFIINAFVSITMYNQCFLRCLFITPCNCTYVTTDYYFCMIIIDLRKKNIFAPFFILK